MEPAQLVGIGGAIGAVLRYLVGLALPDDRFPFSTLVVNILGSFALGLLTFADAGNQLLLFVGVGACGSFTTYSSFSVEVVRLWEDGSRMRAVVYAGTTLLVCLAAVGLAGVLVDFLFPQLMP